MLQFLKCRQQVGDRPAPAVQAPHHHHVDLATVRCLHKLLAGFPVHGAGTDLTDLRCYRPAAPVRVVAHGAHLHRQRLLIVGGHSGVQASTEYFRGSA
jgi:hypothetical protein